MKVSLTDICDFQGGTQPPKDEWIDQPAQGYVRMLQIRDFTQSDKNYIEYVKDTGKLKTCIEDDILIGRYGASIGKILTGLAGAYNVAIVKTIPDEKVVSKKYLYWYLNSQYFQRFISNVGSRAAQAGFNKNDLGAAQIPLVDKERQEEICEVLEKANKLISLRKQQLAKLDELVKARFVEMFGNPSNNSLGFPYEPLSNCLLSIENGKSFVCSNDMRQEENPAILKLSAVTYGVYQQDENKAILDSSMFVKSAEVHKGDLLFTRKNTPELVGMCAYVNDTAPNLMMPDLIFRLNTNEKINKIFLWKLINHEFFRGKIQNIATGSAKSMSNISKERLEKLAIILPPLHLQNDFAALVERVDQQKQTIQQSLEKLELLKKALMQEYFG